LNNDNYYNNNKILLIKPGIICLDTHDTCKNYNITFDESNHHKTMVTEFNLICGRDILVTYATSSMFFGTIFGSLLFSYLGVASLIFNLYKIFI